MLNTGFSDSEHQCLRLVRFFELYCSLKDIQKSLGVNQRPISHSDGLLVLFFILILNKTDILLKRPSEV